MIEVVNGKQVVVADAAAARREVAAPVRRGAPVARRATGAPRATGAAHGRSHPAPGLGHRDRRDLRARRARLHAAVAGVGHDQLRAGRVRDAAGVRDAVLHRVRRCRCGSRSCSTCVLAAMRAGLRLQARHRRPADPPRRDSAGDRDARPVDRASSRSCAPATAPRRTRSRARSPTGSSRSPASTSRTPTSARWSSRGADRRRRCRPSSTGR